MPRNSPLFLFCSSRMLLEQVPISPAPSPLPPLCQSHHHLTAALPLSAVWVHCQITPDSCKGETPSVEPWCPRLPVPWRRGTFPAHTSMCCSQSKSGSSPEYLQCVAQCVSRAGTQQGTRPNVGHWLWELSSNCARHKPQALPTSGIRQGRQPKLCSCFV